MSKTEKITLIIPVYNGALTLGGTFKSLEAQHDKVLIDKIIIINDASKDESLAVIKKYTKTSSYDIKVINHSKSLGLSNSYNEAIEIAKTGYILTMHQDIQIVGNDSFNQMIAPFRFDEYIIATYPILEHSKELWNDYTFWQKSLFSRHIYREERDLTGKFDLFRLKPLKKLNGFDSLHYRTAGEDADLKHRINKSGQKYLCSGVKVIHAQENNSNFGLKNYIHKESQLAEARGCVLRIHGLGNIKDFVANFFREIIVVGLIIPYVQIIFILLMLIYAYFYTKLVYTTSHFGTPLVKLYFINIGLLFINTFHSFKAFILKRQTI